MVTKDEVDNDEECEEIRQDVKEECSSHGEVLCVVIPREKDGFAQAGAGNIYVEFRDAQMAERAALALYGRKFAEKVVIVEYVSLNIPCTLHVALDSPHCLIHYHSSTKLGSPIAQSFKE